MALISSSNASYQKLLVYSAYNPESSTSSLSVCYIVKNKLLNIFIFFHQWIWW